MIKVKVKILFKNGIEKEFIIYTDEEGLGTLYNAVGTVYKGDGNVLLNIGLAFVNLAETVCVEIIQIHEETNNKNSEYNVKI